MHKLSSSLFMPSQYVGAETDDAVGPPVSIFVFLDPKCVFAAILALRRCSFVNAGRGRLLLVTDDLDETPRWAVAVTMPIARTVERKTHFMVASNSVSKL